MESVDSCFLGDMLSAGSAYEPAVIIRGRTVWGKYRNLLPILARLLLSGLKKWYMILASALLCCTAAYPGSLETQTLTDCSKMKEEFVYKNMLCQAV